MSIIKIDDIAYVRFRVPDLDRSRRFLTDFGLVPVDTEGSAVELVLRAELEGGVGLGLEGVGHHQLAVVAVHPARLVCVGRSDSRPWSGGMGSLGVAA